MCVRDWSLRLLVCSFLVLALVCLVVTGVPTYCVSCVRVWCLCVRASCSRLLCDRGQCSRLLYVHGWCLRLLVFSCLVFALAVVCSCLVFPLTVCRVLVPRARAHCVIATGVHACCVLVPDACAYLCAHVWCSRLLLFAHAWCSRV